jgi:methanethiol S-methyltransferase
MARKLGILVYGGAVYALFLVVFVYAIGFVGNVAVPKGIDDGQVHAWWVAAAVNAGLLAIFAGQHSVMARPAFKRWWTRIVPWHAERTTFVLAATLALALLMWGWRPLPAEIWSLESSWARASVWTLYAIGWGIVLLSTFLIDHFDLFGLRQVWARARERAHEPAGFRQPLLYRFIRHPIMSGFIVAFWAAPDMTAGRLLFAAGATGYILVAVRLEERDLRAHLGETYERYMRAVPRFVPRLGRRRDRVPSGGQAAPTPTLRSPDLAG